MKHPVYVQKVCHAGCISLGFWRVPSDIKLHCRGISYLLLIYIFFNGSSAFLAKGHLLLNDSLLSNVFYTLLQKLHS